MSDKTLAAVTTGVMTTEIREFDIPEIPDDGGLLRIEAAGICGADWVQYQRNPFARIMGHENVGRIAKLGAVAARKWNLREGDRVALEEYLPCGHCKLCRSGDFRLCEVTEVARLTGPPPLRYGSTPISVEPKLWGGYSQYMVLHPNSVIHRVRDDVPAHHLAMAIPMSNGFQWTIHEAGVGTGKSVLIQGPGQQGLACVLAAKRAGADLIIVSGLARDAARLAIAKTFGADHTIDVETENLVARVRQITGGEGVDAVIDVAGVPGTMIDGIECLKKAGTLVLGAAPTSVPDFPAMQLIVKRVTVKGLRGHSYAAVEAALDIISSGRYPLDLLATHQFPLDQVDLGIRSIGGQGAAGTIHASIIPP